jgi:hypothetical protein
MTGGKILILGLAIFLLSGWGLEGANAQTSVDPDRRALMPRNGKVVLSSAPSSEAAQEVASPKTPAVDDTTLTGKMLKGKAVPPAKKEKPYPAPEVKDKPYPAPELKKSVGPKKPAVTSPAKTLPAAPVPAPAPTPPPGDSK